MGRKGGGRSGFMKAAARRPGEDDQSDEEKTSQQEAAPAVASTDATKPKQPDAKPTISAKASKFLVDPPKDAVAEPTQITKPVNNGANTAESSDDDDEETANPGVETKGQVLQRHKREAKALKDQIKRLGKKGKDEAAKLEAEMEKRHAQELAALETAKSKTAAEAVAVAGSLYAVSLDDKKGDKKQTKAQKRREQRLKEDQERDERIAAEQAELGETERMAEERELQNLLGPKGFAVYDIPPDGHCLYRSLAHQLVTLPDGGEPLVEKAALASYCDKEDAVSFLTLRQIAGQFMRQHANEFMPFITQGDIDEGAEGKDEFDRYCNAIETTAAWGGHLEIQALSKALQTHIQVYSVGLPVLEMGEEYKGVGPTLTLCYLRHAYGLGEHYNSVVPAAAGEEDEDL